MTLKNSFVLSALLQHNYFPAQKRTKDELPPVFTSHSFTPSIARKLLNVKQRKGDPSGWDAVEYRATRFNGVPRLTSIPHPLAQAHLSICIADNWSKLRYTHNNDISLVRPRQHSDGRLIIMDYERSPEKHERSAQLEFGKRFLAHTDIANFFPSIYSHAVPWATVGFATAKKKKGKKFSGEWFNQLDEKLRWNKRAETQGVAIGPATSNVIAESILARVDATLTGEQFEFVRYIDDYTAYCSTESEARKFIRRLSEELAKYKLLLSIKKTQVCSLPTPREDSWISQLTLALRGSGEITEYEAMSYLELAAGLSKEAPDGSVLKYALKTLLNKKLRKGTEVKLIPQVLAHAFHQPALLPVLSSLFDRVPKRRRFKFARQLRAIVRENALNRRSDGVCWGLYILARNGGEITTELASKIINTEDCCSVLLLWASEPKLRAEVIRFVRGLDKSDYYELDRYWLLLYQLFAAGVISNPYASEEAFPFLKTKKVSFLDLSKLAAPTHSPLPAPIRVKVAAASAGL